MGGVFYASRLDVDRILPAKPGTLEGEETGVTDLDTILSPIRHI